ncbi:hypothetical protein M1316_01705 [Candidatus Parvarchaeota archaeon]|nr:hypothetical protein [Candidatus Parvarchaeota archaeon]
MIRLEKKLNRTLRKKVLEEFDGSNYYPAPDGRWWGDKRKKVRPSSHLENTADGGTFVSATDYTDGRRDTFIGFSSDLKTVYIDKGWNWEMSSTQYLNILKAAHITYITYIR